MPTVSEADCRRAADEHAGELLSLPDVVGLGVGVSGTSNCVKVYVSGRRARPAIPPILELRGEAGTTLSVPVQVEEVGPLGID